MHDWSLAPGDPLYLTLAADARLSIPDYLNDHIWELTLVGGGEPPAALIAKPKLPASTARTPKPNTTE